MSRDDCDNSSTAVLAFLAGTVVGAAIALLTAPKTGQETREMLADYGAELKDRAKTLPDDFQEYKETAIERSKEMIAKGKELISRGTDLATQGKDFLDEKKRTLSEAIEAGKIAMQEEREALAHKLEDKD
ncbi:MAG: YtxH domain-containing protein [Deltaproteobacteria bacterium]|uniref:YtxH domain-containing protein n=1 Tax=Hydrosulfovibrio ferrireducens TaxID=2934181 RepID=UPI0012269AA4|nr:MAG: YtxH domain-containing protein [Deltaproteobacteria bacterium]